MILRCNTGWYFMIGQEPTPIAWRTRKEAFRARQSLFEMGLLNI